MFYCNLDVKLVLFKFSEGANYSKLFITRISMITESNNENYIKDKGY